MPLAKKLSNNILTILSNIETNLIRITFKIIVICNY